jgi:sec-independent protein translocase protein TatB
MLDFGFSEILLTSAIALVVLGPERLPKVARQVGNWMGRARAMARQLSEQLEREVSADEIMKAQTRKLEAPATSRIAPTASGHPEYNPPVAVVEAPVPPAVTPPSPHAEVSNRPNE